MSIYSHNVKINRVKSEGKVIGKVYCHNLVKYDITGINPIQHRITVITNNSTIGTVSGGGVYNDGDTCTLTANYTDDYQFDGWYVNGNKVNSNDNYSFTVNSDLTVSAMFSEPYVGKVLYSTLSPAENTLTYTMSDNLENYSYIDVYWCGWNSGALSNVMNLVPQCTRIWLYSGAKEFTLSRWEVYNDSTYYLRVREHIAEFNYSGTTLNCDKYGSCRYASNSSSSQTNYVAPTYVFHYKDGSASSDRYIFLYKIVGYKNYNGTSIYSTISGSTGSITTSKTFGDTYYEMYNKCWSNSSGYRGTGFRLLPFAPYVFIYNDRPLFIAGSSSYIDSHYKPYKLQGTTVEQGTNNSPNYRFGFRWQESSTNGNIVTTKPTREIQVQNEDQIYVNQINEYNISSHGTVLYTYDQQRTSYTLSDNINNYEYIDIYYTMRDYTTTCYKERVYIGKGNVGKVNIVLPYYKCESSNMYLMIMAFTLSGTTLSEAHTGMTYSPHMYAVNGYYTKTGAFQSATYAYSCRTFTDSPEYIEKIVGYKGEYMF